MAAPAPSVKPVAPIVAEPVVKPAPKPEVKVASKPASKPSPKKAAHKAPEANQFEQRQLVSRPAVQSFDRPVAPMVALPIPAPSYPAAPNPIVSSPAPVSAPLAPEDLSGPRYLAPVNQIQTRGAPVSSETAGSVAAAAPSPNGPSAARNSGALMGLDPSVPMRAYLGPRNGAAQTGMRP